MSKLFAYLAFAVCVNMFSPSQTITTNLHRHLHHHNHQQRELQQFVPQHYHHRHNNNTNNSHNVVHVEHHVDFYYDPASQTNWDRNKTSTMAQLPLKSLYETTTSLAAKAQSSSTTKPTKNSLKLSLIHANEHSFVANGYSHTFNRNFNRWPIAPPTNSNTRHTDFDVKWRAANHPFMPNFNPSIESKPITSTTTTATVATVPHRTYRDQRMHNNKHHTGIGRHVCVEHTTILLPIRDNRNQTARDRRMITAPCNDATFCKNSRLYFDNSNTIPQRTTTQRVYSCCPGWSKLNKNSHGCTKPICKFPCKNNGKCVKPEQCNCPAGFTGKHCELDINECMTDKPCDQTCYNTEGSFYCTCRLGFVLHTDKQSCKKIDSSFGNDDTGTAFEARDLENDVVETDDLSAKFNNIEKLIVAEKERNLETTKLMHSTIEAVNSLKRRLDGLENRPTELNLIRERLKTFEIQAYKLEHTVDLLYKCRHKPGIYCP